MNGKPTVGSHDTRIGVDVGGTFTDVVVVDQDGAIHTLKLPSTPDDFSKGVSEGVRRLMEIHAVAPASIRDVVHGSTVATNAILERKGALTGLLTTAGFRDVLELRRLRIPKLYDMTWRKPAPLVERYLRREVIERVDIDGAVVTPLEHADLRRGVEELVAHGVESIAVCLLHSYSNPEHERAIGDLLSTEYPTLWVSLSHRVLPIIREYERTSTTVLNAYIQPSVASYLLGLRDQFDQAGILAPLFIMQSNGGVMSSAAAAEKPAFVVESGPAAGVIASAALAHSLGIEEVITFDMGGTTAKASIIEGGQPHFTSEFEVAAGISASSRLSSGGGYALSVPFIDLAEVGAGGGSIVWIDSAGAPKVGPSSAGAIPGPVCYGIGGKSPTVTDVNLLLGYLNPAGLLGGGMPVQSEEAGVVFEREISDRLGLDRLDAAFGCHLLANASMIRAIKAVSVQRGRDPRDFTLVAFGGNGPVHAAGMARELGIRRIIVPPRPGVFSAVGLLQARLECHVKKSFLRRTRDLEPGELETQLKDLEEEAAKGVGRESLRERPFEFQGSADMRYVGQGFELPVALPDGREDWSVWLNALAEEFEVQHERTYGHRTGNPTEIVHLSVVVRETAQPEFPEDQIDSRFFEKGTTSSREVFFGAPYGLIATTILQRNNLAESSISGPLIVEDYDATTVVPPDYSCRIDGTDNIVIEKNL